MKLKMKTVINPIKDGIIILSITFLFIVITGMASTKCSSDHYSSFEIFAGESAIYIFAWPVCFFQSTFLKIVFVLLWQIILSAIILIGIKVIIAKIKSNFNQSPSGNPAPPSS